mmetsp:Transcript_47915/g.112653  ORF Transcript_47915/g.112653 Transcript_47915/m.112653 type:complete len:228 (-) Transcript_47915:117-800(-)
MPLADFLREYKDPQRKREIYWTQFDMPVGIPHFGGEQIKRGAEGTSKSVYCVVYLSADRYIWMGAGGETSPAHYDYYDNVYAVVKGAKRFTLAPLSSSPYLYPHQPGEGHAGYDTLQLKVDLHNPDADRFPLVKKAQIFEVVVHEGDALFIPAFWWHRVESLSDDTTIAISYWLQEAHAAPAHLAPPHTKLADTLQDILDKDARIRNNIASDDGSEGDEEEEEPGFS